MSLLEESLTHRRQGGAPCAVSDLRVANPALYAELLTALAAAPNGRPIQASAISTALKEEHGIFLSGDMLTRHRRGDCLRCRS